MSKPIDSTLTRSVSEGSEGRIPEPDGCPVARSEPRLAQPALRQQVIGFLRGEDNPFDVFVARQMADKDIVRWHVPEIHTDVLAKIHAAIEKIGRPSYHHRPTLHPTRVLVVRGPRGAGKTHLLHAIQYRAGGEHDLLVRPRYFETHPTFAEYLLKELLRGLLARDENEPPSPLEWAADRVTRRLLVEALAALTPGEWLEWTCRPGLLGIFAGRRWTRQTAAHAALMADLAAPSETGPVHEQCAARGLGVSAARQVLEHHIARCDRGLGSVVRMRVRLLKCLAELALTRSREPFARFIEHDFAEVEGGLPPTRAELVDDLLRTLVELFAACEVPVIVAFDNIERLLAPRGRLDTELAQSFFSGMAQVIDSVPGLLILLFVEGGLWVECQRQAIDSFALDRLMQGVRLRNHGIVAQLDLEPPNLEQLEQLVRRRMKDLLDRVNSDDGLPELFPFERADLEQVARFENDVLRAALMRLRDRYDELVLPGETLRHEVVEPVVEPARTTLSQLQIERELFVPKWDTAVTRARRELGSAARGTLSDKLHGGLGHWLATFTDGDRSGGMKLLRVEPNVTFGDHPTYGVVTVAHWQKSDGTADRIALGVVLGQGVAMPKDLSVKLALLDLRPAPADALIVLWPDRDFDFESSNLPPASQQVWTKQAAGKRVWLLGLPSADLAWLLAFADWSSDLKEIDASERAAWPGDAIERFVRARTAALFERLQPRESTVP